MIPPQLLSSGYTTVLPADMPGRADALETLHTLLSIHHRVVVHHPVGGLGKTTLLLGYLHNYASRYQHIVWISQKNKNIAYDIVSHEPMVSHLQIDTVGKGVPEVLQEINTKLNALPTATANLFVVDDANASILKIAGQLPASPRWHILLASEEPLEGFHAFALGPLSTPAAVAVFQKHCPSLTDQAAITTFLALIGYNTLMLEIAAKSAHVLNLLAAQLQTATNLAALLGLSQLNKNEVWLMRYLAFLPSEYYTANFLLDLIGQHAQRKKVVLYEALASLALRGWLHHDQETDSYKMHQLVAALVMNEIKITPHSVDTMIGSIRQKVWIPYKKDDEEAEAAPLPYLAWLPYSYPFLKYFRYSSFSDSTLFRIHLATIYRWLGDYADAKQLLDDTITAQEKAFGKNNRFAFMTYPEIVKGYLKIEAYKEAVEVSEKILVNDRAEDYRREGQNHAALVTVMKAFVHHNERKLGKHHPETISSYREMGRIYEVHGFPAKAKPWYAKAENHVQAEAPTDITFFTAEDLTYFSTVRGIRVASGTKNFQELETALTETGVFAKTYYWGQLLAKQGYELEFNHEWNKSGKIKQSTEARISMNGLECKLDCDRHNLPEQKINAVDDYITEFCPSARLQVITTDKLKDMTWDMLANGTAQFMAAHTEECLELIRIVSVKNSAPQPEKFTFVEGHNPDTKKGVLISAFSAPTYSKRLRHQEIQHAVYNQLTELYANSPVKVGTEQSTGLGTFIDLVVHDPREGYTFYEIKTGSSALGCIREAIGQMLEYCYYPDKQHAGKLVIIAPHPIDNTIKQYMNHLRTVLRIALYYQPYSLKKQRLEEAMA
jgi:hypothetical protein